MNIFEAILMGLVQGLTEFIPVSSSGHLLLLQDALGIEAFGLTFDVALHVGTLMALILFFYSDIIEITKSVFVKSDKTRLAYLLAAATIPAVIAGMLLEKAADTTFRSSVLVGFTLIIVGGLMLLAEKTALGRKSKTEVSKVGWRQGLIIGVAQAAALIPGVSRSGSTITTGLFVGLDRVAATRFSFLLAIPITVGATLKVLLEPDGLQAIGGEADLFIAGIASAFISGIVAIRFLLKFVSKHTLASFAYYRIFLGLIVFLLLLKQ